MATSSSVRSAASSKAISPVRSSAGLLVSRPGDVHEREADRAADLVHSGAAAGQSLTWSLSKIGTDALLQRECACGGTCDACKKRKLLQREARGVEVTSQSASLVQETLSGAGQSLDQGTRQFMESRFGHDFSNVKIHHDETAARSATSVSANAYTVGTRIVFNRGKYAPQSASGRRLLAHELAHVVQQTQPGPQKQAGDPSLETEAGSVSQRLDQPGSMPSLQHSSAVGIAREAAPTAQTQTLIEVKFPEGTRRLTQAEFAEYKRRALANLRRDLVLVTQHADVGRQSQISMLAQYQGGVESLWDVVKKPKALYGIAADIKAGVTPPFVGAWDHPKSIAAQGIAACDRGDLAEAARILSRADADYRQAMQAWNNYRAATIGGAEGVASNLETVRDISFAIALVAGAAIAAPVIAGVVGTGVVGTALTAGGTAIVTGAGGVVLGGGSTALASKATNGKVDWKGTKAAAAKFGKEGAVTGLTAGLGTSLSVAGKGAKLAQPFVQSAAKRCLTEAGINVAGELTTEGLEKILPSQVIEKQVVEEQAGESKKPVLDPRARVALTGCLSGALGVPVAKLGRTGGKATDVAVNVGVGYTDARLAGKTNEEALMAGGQSALTSAVVARGHKGTEQAKAAKSAHRQEPSSTALKPPSPTNEPPPASGSSKVPSTETTHSQPAVAATPAEKTRNKLKSTLAHEGTPAVLKEDAKAKQSVGDGHEVVVTQHGIGKCSPSPCPVIHVEYANQLKEHPWASTRYKELQKLRLSDPHQAAIESARFVKVLEMLKNRQGKAPVPHDAKPRPKNTGNIDIPAQFAQQLKENPWARERYKKIEALKKRGKAEQAQTETRQFVADLENLKRDPNAFGFGAVSRDLGLQPAKKPTGGIRRAVADAIKAGFVTAKGAPRIVDAALQPHGSASTIRDEFGLIGKNSQSAHIGPTSALRKLTGYSRSEALTMLLPSKTHAAFDSHWKEWAQNQRRKGKTTATVAELQKIMNLAIQKTPNLSAETKGAIAWQLGIELYRDLGLRPNDRFVLPYPNVKKQ